MKVMYQQLWEGKLGWDSGHFADQHLRWRNELPLLATKRQPRCYFNPSATRLTTQLHGFSDASMYAYAAVVYIRATYVNHPPTCTLVSAKTRVAPVKPLSIPRLELCGAALLAKLLASVRQALDISLDNTVAWCDSTIVLSWLDGNAKRFKTFVGNRLAAILSDLPPSTWHHVPTLSNPANEPVQPLLVTDSTPELKAVCHSATLVPPVWIEDKHNDYKLLIHITAWCFRFVSNLRASLQRKSKRTTKHLLPAEIKSAEHYLFHISQLQSFSQEVNKLNHNQSISPSSPIISLSPYLDKNGLLRVGGRLSQSSLSLSNKHPIILSGKTRLCYLLCTYKHVALSHCGPSLLLCSTGCRLHIVGARRLTRSVCKSCVTCLRAVARTQSQMMGQLPSSRITPSPPFSTCGVDYAGPFQLKRGYVRKPQTVKANLCIFVCFSTKAVHVEAVSDATTEAFVECLKRFISRKGSPSHIYSDNGGNSDLKQLYKFLEETPTQTTITTYLLSERITWHASPERAPHFGGLWEAAVKSFKTHIKRVVGCQKLNFEELTTVAAQVEACLNSRPLAAATTHSLDGVEFLTLGHFIIGRPIKAYPEQPRLTEPSLNKRWNLCPSIITHFWRRWSLEYLQQLQRLQKWRTPSPNLKVGDIVSIKEDTTFTAHWPAARVVEVHPGQDGLVRVTTVRTQTSTLKRPVAKLVLLLSELPPDSLDEPVEPDRPEEDQPGSPSVSSEAPSMSGQAA